MPVNYRRPIQNVRFLLPWINDVLKSRPEFETGHVDDVSGADVMITGRRCWYNCRWWIDENTVNRWALRRRKVRREPEALRLVSDHVTRRRGGDFRWHRRRRLTPVLDGIVAVEHDKTAGLLRPVQDEDEREKGETDHDSNDRRRQGRAKQPTSLRLRRRFLASQNWTDIQSINQSSWFETKALYSALKD